VKTLASILFLITALTLATVAQTTNLYCGSKVQFVSDTTQGDFTTDTLFVVTEKYISVAFTAFGNAGEYAKVRQYVGNKTYGTFYVPAGMSVNPPNWSKTLTNYDIDLHTLTDWINAAGDTIRPRVLAEAFK